MAGLSLSGLASGLDWKTLVDQLIQVDSAPITRIQKEQSTNTQRSNALKDLNTKLTSLQTAAAGLKDQTLFSGRTASSDTTGSTWTIAATSGTATGSHTISVSQLATKARREGAADITAGLNATSNVAGLTLASLRTASTVTAGTFTLNGQKITVATTDSLQDVFDRIATATGNDVTGSYDPVTDKVSLTSASDSEIILGAANDSTNFLQVLKLANNGTDTVASFGPLGAARTNNPLVSSGLRTSITAVDGAGDGSFTINGTAISYNVNTDSLSTVIKRINGAGAGVTASYDAVNDRVILANNTTGDQGMTLSETSGGLLAALGLTTGAATVRGQDARFSVDGGPTLISSSNTLEGSAHGIAGLSVTVDTATSQTISVAADTDKMRSKISDFISAYNAVQTYIDDKSKVTTANGKVTTSVLTSNRDVQDWTRQLRSLAFNAISGLSDTVDRLDDLGLDLDREGQLSIKDSTKLDAALADRPTDVEAFFTTPSTGFAAKFDTLLDKLISTSTDTQDRLTKNNTDLDRQIADIQRHLDQQREILTNSFIAMESAQSKIQQQSSALTNAFSSTSSK